MKFLRAGGFFACFLLFFSIQLLHASKVVEGIVFCKNGEVAVFQEDARLYIPKKKAPVKGFSNYYSSHREKREFAFDAVDSIVCWSPSHKEITCTYIPEESLGWVFSYISTPSVCVYVYSKAGYSMSANGGMSVVRNGSDMALLFLQFSLKRSAYDYYLKKPGAEKPFRLGGVNKSLNKSFKKRICTYLSDDPQTCKAVMESDKSRNRTVLLLENYKRRVEP